MLPLQSESLAQLTAALVEAQKGIAGAQKSGDNPHLKSRYATLADVWEACRDPLTANGLCVTSSLEESEHGLTLRTSLRHISGEWLASLFPIQADPTKPQQIGSALTYARRYCLSALVGVCPEDDDGEAAQAAAPRQAERRRTEGRERVNGEPRTRQPPRPQPPRTHPQPWSFALDGWLKRWDGFEPILGLVPSTSPNEVKSKEQVSREHRIAHELVTAAIHDECQVKGAVLTEARLAKPAEAGKDPVRDPAKVWAAVKALWAEQPTWCEQAVGLYLEEKKDSWGGVPEAN
jgi:hypothetical protein